MSRFLAFLSFLLYTVGVLHGQERLFDTNLVKANLLPLALRSYGLSYETTFSKHWSVGFAVSHRPKNSFPLRDKIEDYYTDNDIAVHGMEISHFSVTPEFRYYVLPESACRGFYINNFIRYSRYGYSSRIDYIGMGTANSTNYQYDGAINTLTVGAGVGRQWRFGNCFYLDWNIISLHFGLNTGHVVGERIGGPVLGSLEHQILENKPNEFNTPLVDIDIVSQDTRVDVYTKGGWAGVRSALSIGYRF